VTAFNKLLDIGAKITLTRDEGLEEYVKVVGEFGGREAVASFGGPYLPLSPGVIDTSKEQFGESMEWAAAEILGQLCQEPT